MLLVLGRLLCKCNSRLQITSYFISNVISGVTILITFKVMLLIRFDYFSTFLRNVLTVNHFQTFYASRVKLHHFTKLPLNGRRHRAHQKQAKQQVNIIQLILAFNKKIFSCNPLCNH